MRTLTLNASFASALLTLALAGCPGDSDDTTGGSTTTNTTPPATDPSTSGESGTTSDDPTQSSNDTPAPGETTTSTDPDPDTTTSDPTIDPDPTTTTNPSDDTTDTGDDTTTAPAGLSFEVDVYPSIIQPSCGCHVGGTGGLTLGGDAASAFAAIVGVGSSAGIPQVDPGNSDNSYVWHKINGSHADVGGGGGQMPKGGAPLSADKIATFAQWINEGANP